MDLCIWFFPSPKKGIDRSEKLLLKVCGITRLMSSEVEVIDNIIIWILL